MVEGFEREDLPDDRGGLDGTAIFGAEAVDPCQHDRLDRARDGLARLLLAAVGQPLDRRE